jgi:hypothetical protein
MAKTLVNETVLEGVISARINDDDSLTIMVRYIGTDEQWSWEDIIALSPEGVKVLRDLLDRDAQLRNEADDVGQTCPLCGGRRVILSGDTKILCPACTVTGHV